MALGEPLDVQLIDHRLVPGYARWTIVAPGKGRINDHGEGGIRRTVPVVKGQIGVGVPHAVGKKLVGPPDIAANRLGIGVEHQLAGVKAVALLRLVRAVDPVAVELPRQDLGQVNMPDLVGPFRHRQTLRRLRRVDRVEETELDLGGILRKEGEIDALAVPGRPEWIRIPWPYAHSAASVCEVRGPRGVLCSAVLMRSRSLGETFF